MNLRVSDTAQICAVACLASATGFAFLGWDCGYVLGFGFATFISLVMAGVMKDNNL